jgi:hypothetical protein
MLQTYVYNEPDEFLKVGLVLISEKTTTTSPPGAPFRLLDLPPELRLAIFDLAIVKPKAIRLTLKKLQCLSYHSHMFRSCPYCESNRLCFPPALARVSRSIRHDALKIFYGQNKFKAPLEYIDSAGMAEWLGNVGIEYRGLVRMGISTQWPHHGHLFNVDYATEILRKAGWEPKLRKHRHGS